MTDPKVDFDLTYENVSFVSTQPHAQPPMLRGWYIPVSEGSKSRPTKVGLIAVHGGGRDRREWLPHLGYWNKAGFEVLMYDSSEHGLSDGTGEGLGFGFREQFDVIGAARYAKSKLGWEKVVCLGTSVGAASTIMAAGREPTIDGVIAENPFYDYEPFFTKIYRDFLVGGAFGGRDAAKYGLIVDLLTRLSDLLPLEHFITNVASFTRWWIGASGQPGPIDALPSISPRPIFFIHGEADLMIPPSHSRLLFEKSPGPKQLWTPPKGQHADVLRFYPEEYPKRFVEFIENHVLSTSAATAA